jgi:hypothetical protein
MLRRLKEEDEKVVRPKDTVKESFEKLMSTIDRIESKLDDLLNKDKIITTYKGEKI